MRKVELHKQMKMAVDMVAIVQVRYVQYLLSCTFLGSIVATVFSLTAVSSTLLTDRGMCG